MPNDALTDTLISRETREKIVLVGVALDGSDPDDVDISLDELSQLVDTAGADAVARVVQKRNRPDPATYIGKGKVDELKQVSLEVDSDTVVFDDELTPAQQYNLERMLGRTAIDRTAVILDIFAQNAASVEGKAQVELALLKYRLPRLRGKGKGLSQQAGGMSAGGGARIGTRGPGETQLETDRRRLVRRIHKLESDLVDISRTRATQRKSRSRSRLQHVAIVGYTNAGKSTLLNRLTDAGVLVENRLFATLDATTRRLALPGGEPVLLTDTVGFIKKLPHGLVEAFKSTLEVVNEADLLVHVVDAASAEPEAQIDAVRDVLHEIGSSSIPELLCFNKSDLDPVQGRRLVAQHHGSVTVSAVTGAGIDDLLVAVGDRLRALTTVVELVVPYDRGDVLAAVHREGEVVLESAGPEAMRFRVRLDEAGQSKLREFLVDGGAAAAGGEAS